MESFDAAETFNDDYLWFYETMLTAERNRSETDEIVATLDVAAGSSILDAPCGHGRISNLLAVDGFRVTGVDLTGLFLERASDDAEQLGVEVDFQRGDLRSLPVSGPFDAAICWFTSFGYFDDDDNKKVLDEFARVLRPGGRLLIETMHHDGFVRGFVSAPAATVTERGDDVMSDVSTFDPITGRIETERTVRRDGDLRRSHHSVRLPTVPELDAWLSSAGFTTRAFSDRAGLPLRFDSWRLVAVAVREVARPRSDAVVALGIAARYISLVPEELAALRHQSSARDRRRQSMGEHSRWSRCWRRSGASARALRSGVCGSTPRPRCRCYRVSSSGRWGCVDSCLWRLGDTTSCMSSARDFRREPLDLHARPGRSSGQRRRALPHVDVCWAMMSS